MGSRIAYTCYGICKLKIFHHLQNTIGTLFYGLYVTWKLNKGKKKGENFYVIKY